MTRCLAPCLAVLALSATPCLVHADEDEGAHPGVVSIDWPSELGGAEPNVRVRVKGPLLRLMASATRHAPEVDGLIGQLRLVRVEVYEDLDSGANAAAAVAPHVEGLTAAGWESVVRVRDDDDESVDVMVRPDGEESIAGVAVFVAEEDELVFVNVAGDLDAKNFGSKLGKVLGPIMKGELDLEELIDVEEVVEYGGHDHDEDHDDDHEEDEDDD